MKISPNVEVVTFPVLKVTDFTPRHEVLVRAVVHNPSARRLAGLQRRHLFEATKVYPVTFLRAKNKSPDKVTDRRGSQL